MQNICEMHNNKWIINVLYIWLKTLLVLKIITTESSLHEWSGCISQITENPKAMDNVTQINAVGSSLRCYIFPINLHFAYFSPLST